MESGVHHPSRPGLRRGAVPLVQSAASEPVLLLLDERCSEATRRLEFVLPGASWIARDYSVPSESWPLTKDGRNLAFYGDHNEDDGHSYFVHGAVQDFTGGYWHDSQFGYGHWALHEEVPGQKLWLWPKSRDGAMWHDLLTDNDGPYFEPQTGRLLDQNDHEFLAPDSADHWRQLYFPYKKIGPMAKAIPLRRPQR